MPECTPVCARDKHGTIIHEGARVRTDAGRVGTAHEPPWWALRVVGLVLVRYDGGTSENVRHSALEVV